jgi:hypothetical protein
MSVLSSGKNGRIKAPLPGLTVMMRWVVVTIYCECIYLIPPTYGHLKSVNGTYVVYILLQVKNKTTH